MSELINNNEIRQKLLKKIILSLHDGSLNLEQAKVEFQKNFGTITTEEITQMEQSLLKEGIKVEQIQELCDVHAAVFEGSVEEIHSSLKRDYSTQAGHPVQVFMNENELLEKLIKEEIEPYFDASGKTNLLMLRIGFDRLWEIDKHYARKEYLFFPHLEKRGITAPPKVMWGVDDEIRVQIKEVIALLNEPHTDEKTVWEKGKTVIQKVRDMIKKENTILIPLLKENLNLVNWIDIDKASHEMGYFLETPKDKWQIKEENVTDHNESKPNTNQEGTIKFDAGSLSFEQVNLMLNTLPFDMTFVDKDGYVRYFTMGKERIFPRPLTVIGRHVTMCHPPASVHVVEEIIESFRSGKKEHEDFWINMKGRMVYIRYFAVRDKNGEFLGTLEITQDIQPIRDLQGEKRLVDK
jgi:hypothetical protein